jgi:dethiobiotin synthetase
MSARFQCFVTGTDTEIGKTLVSSAMLHALAKTGVQAAGMKPVAAGASLRDGIRHNDDVDRLTAASNVKLPVELAVPYLLREPAAPHRAAALEGVQINAAYILSCHVRAANLVDALVVEGVGGFRVPLTDDFDTADLAQQLQLPVVMVVGLRLGCINHALLSADAIAARGLTLAGWVANLVDPQMRHVEANLEALRARLQAPLLGYIPHLLQATAAAAAGYVDFSMLPNWPQRVAASS